MAEQLAPDAPLELFHMKLNQPQVNARLGKLAAGDIVAVPRDLATRLLAAGVAEQVSSDEYNQKRERRAQKASARQEALRALNEGHALWDVSTYRDVLTAPEGGLRLAWERGIPLVNVHMLRDEDGDPLPPDAHIDEILEARQFLHPDLVAPLAAHDRSSVMGGGSPYSGPMPLSPQHRAMAEAIAREDATAQAQAQSIQNQLDDSGSSRAPAGRAGRAVRRAESREEQGPASSAVSAGPGPAAPQPPPPPPSGPQVGNAPERK